MSDAAPLPGETPLLRWSAPVHPAHERTPRWYLIGGGIVLGVAAYGLLTGAWSLALVAVMCGAMYFLLRSHTFPDSTMLITQNGAKLDETFLSWQDAQGFWIMLTPEYEELHIVPRNPRSRELVIQTGDQELNRLRETIGAFIPELGDKRERFIDAIIRICKL